MIILVYFYSFLFYCTLLSSHVFPLYLLLLSIHAGLQHSITYHNMLSAFHGMIRSYFVPFSVTEVFFKRGNERKCSFITTNDFFTLLHIQIKLYNNLMARPQSQQWRPRQRSQESIYWNNLTTDRQSCSNKYGHDRITIL